MTFSGGNECKLCFEKKVKHCPFAYGAKTGGRRKNKSFRQFFQKNVQTRVKLWSPSAEGEIPYRLGAFLRVEQVQLECFAHCDERPQALPLDTTNFFQKLRPKTLVSLCRNFFVPTSECVNESERRVLKLPFYTKPKREIVPSFKLVQAEPAGNCNKQMAGGICKIIQCTN